MKVACTVWLGAKGVKASDLSRFLLKEEQTAAYSVEIWKRFRKWGGIPTGITQNIKDLLSSREIENIFENSDFIYMLNQASGDRKILAKQLNISPTQLSYVRDVDVLNVTLNSGNLMSICQDRLGFFQKELFSAYNDTKGNLQMFATPVDFNWYSSVTSYYGC